MVGTGWHGKPSIDWHDVPAGKKKKGKAYQLWCRKDETIKMRQLHGVWDQRVNVSQSVGTGLKSTATVETMKNAEEGARHATILQLETRLARGYESLAWQSRERPVRLNG